MGLTAFDREKNAMINVKLASLYDECTPAFLSAWSAAFEEVPPRRMNEFGIIDVDRYNAEEGILFIGRETNGWDDKDYEEGCLFRNWLCDISRSGIQGRGHVSKHPNMWYNIGRWALLMQSPEMSVDVLAQVKTEAIEALGTIAFTNINKVRGKNKIGKEYNKLTYADVVKRIIQEEVAIIKPKAIITCGTWHPVASYLPDYDGKIIRMNHPGARKTSRAMLQELKEQLG